MNDNVFNKVAEKPFNITMPEGTKDINITYEEKQTKKINQWNIRNYVFNSVQSFADFINAKCIEDKTIIVYNDEYIKAVLDETVQDRPLEHAKYEYQRSLEFKAWGNIFGKRLLQKDFIKFLKSREPNEIVGNVENISMQFSKLNMITSIVGEYCTSDNGDVTFAYKETTGKEGVASIPTSMKIQIPLLNESDYVQEMEIEIEITRPKSEDDKPMIILTCTREELYLKRAIAAEVEKLKNELAGYMVLSGVL